MSKDFDTMTALDAKSASDMTTIRFEVLPDEAGGWSVTCDRVFTAGFDHKLRAEHHALTCCPTAALSGTKVNLVVFSNDGNMQQDRNFSPSLRVIQPMNSRRAQRFALSHHERIRDVRSAKVSCRR